MSPVAEYDQLENPYRSTQYAAAEPELIGIDELRAFVGGNAVYYLRKWTPRLTSPDGECGMNWAAFFLTSMWMFYRKMYRNGLICIGAGMLTSLGLNVLFLLAFRTPTVPFSATLIVNVLFCLVCGAFGNAWYLSHTERKIAMARAQGLTGDRLLFTLQQRGGTSLLMVFLVFGLALMFGIFVGILTAAAGAAAR
jgi:hypothetical protein